MNEPSVNRRVLRGSLCSLWSFFLSKTYRITKNTKNHEGHDDLQEVRSSKQLLSFSFYVLSVFYLTIENKKKPLRALRFLALFASFQKKTPRNKPGRLRYVSGLVTVYYIFLLACALAAGDDPEINTDKTDLIKRKMLREGL